MSYLRQNFDFKPADAMADSQHGFRYINVPTFDSSLDENDLEDEELFFIHRHVTPPSTPRRRDYRQTSSLSSTPSRRTRRYRSRQGEPREQLELEHCEYRGQLKMAVYVNCGLLTVHVIGATDLQSTQSQLTTCNSYVKLSLIPDKLREARCCTKTALNTNSPTFDTKFTFELADEDLEKRLYVSVYNRNTDQRRSDFLGCFSFGIQNLLHLSKPINGWYYLLEGHLGQALHFPVKKQTPPRRTRGKISPTTTASNNQHLQQVNETKKKTRQREHSSTSPAVNFGRQPLPIYSNHSTENHTVIIHRSEVGFGFSVTGSNPVCVGRVHRGSAADGAGLREGDVIDRIDGLDVSYFTCEMVASVIKASVSMIALTIERASPNPISLCDNSKNNRPTADVQSSDWPPRVWSHNSENPLDVSFQEKFSWPTTQPNLPRCKISAQEHQHTPNKMATLAIQKNADVITGKESVRASNKCKSDPRRKYVRKEGIIGSPGESLRHRGRSLRCSANRNVGRYANADVCGKKNCVSQMPVVVGDSPVCYTRVNEGCENDKENVAPNERRCYENMGSCQKNGFAGEAKRRVEDDEDSLSPYVRRTPQRIPKVRTTQIHSLSQLDSVSSSATINDSLHMYSNCDNSRLYSNLSWCDSCSLEEQEHIYESIDDEIISANILCENSSSYYNQSPSECAFANKSTMMSDDEENMYMLYEPGTVGSCRYGLEPRFNLEPTRSCLKRKTTGFRRFGRTALNMLNPRKKIAKKVTFDDVERENGTDLAYSSSS